MPTPNDHSATVGQLRTVAEDKLKSGTAPSTKGWPSSAQTLTLLHSLASDPARATDALKLLHELQVHQVELDLQHEQLEQERLLYAQSMEAYIDLFDAAPCVYLTLDAKGRLLDASRIGDAWLGVPRSEWLRRPVWTFFASESRMTIQNALGQLLTGSETTTFTARSAAAGDTVQVTVCAARERRPVLMAFMPNAQTPGT